MDCKEMILSEETYDIITDFSASEFLGDDNNCYERIGEDFLILYLANLGIRNPKIDFFPYHNMPKLQASRARTRRVPSIVRRSVRLLRKR